LLVKAVGVRWRVATMAALRVSSCSSVLRHSVQAQLGPQYLSTAKQSQYSCGAGCGERS